MRALIQRVSSAAVRVDGEVVAQIGEGVCVFVGVAHADDAGTARRTAEKLWNLRIFDDMTRKPNLSAADLGLEVLVVSQFTLYADTSKGRRPSYLAAADPQEAEPLVELLVDEITKLGARTQAGTFGADMQVTLTNEGPFTVLLEV